MVPIRIAIIGVGNCASSLVQGIHFYRTPRAESLPGLLNPLIGGYGPSDIEIVRAYDIDARKVGKDLSQAILAPPNCTHVFNSELPFLGVDVGMGRVLDGVSKHMRDQQPSRSFLVADAPEPREEEIVNQLRSAGAEVLVNYLPVGSTEATAFYARCALQAGAAMVNAIPVFLASDEAWALRFREAHLPLIGDDIKAQLGATIVHRALIDLCAKRGVTVDRTYQLNTGGNTDFLNMLDRSRLSMKKLSKTEAVQAVVAREPLPDDNIHVGPSDYVPWQRDNKVCYLRIEGRVFGSVPFNLELRLSVEDSPNSAGVVIDAIRCCKLAFQRGEGGVLQAPSMYFCKHPPRQVTDSEAYQMLQAFLVGSHGSGPAGQENASPHFPGHEEDRCAEGN